MFKLLLLLIGPTIMIFLGLVTFKNVPITFILFYGWLLLFSFYNLRKRHQRILIVNAKSILVGFISGLICLSAIYGTVYFLKSSVFNLTELRELLIEWNFTSANVFWLVLFIIFINPILEEIYWREFMYGELASKLGATTSIIITAFFYSLYHLLSVYFIFSFPFNLLAVLPVFFAGVMWAFFRYKLKSVIAPIISHVLADLGIMLVYINLIL